MINTNVASLFTRRSLTQNASRRSVHVERLSTGLRINSAKDDAAGLQIGMRFTSQVRGLKQGLRNTNDAVSLSQTAEAAMAEIANLGQRIRVLAVQAASDSNTLNDRLVLQGEAEQAIAEIYRVVEQTTFNGRTLLDGSFMDSIFQVGANQRDVLEVDVRDLRKLGSQATHQGASVPQMANPLAFGDVEINGFKIRATTAADDEVSAIDKASSAIAKAKAINEAGRSNVRAVVNATVRVGGAIPGGFVPNNGIRINGWNIGPVFVAAGDANGALRAAINRLSDQTAVVASLSDAGQIVLTAEDGRNIWVDATFLGALRTGLAAGISYGTITLESDYSFTVGGNAPENAGLTAGYYAAMGSLHDVDLTSREAASAAIDIMDRAIRQVSRERAKLGAVMNRLDAALNAQAAGHEAQSATLSQIMDADVALEAAGLASREILTQAAASIFAQANTAPEVALSLLRAA